MLVVLTVADDRISLLDPHRANPAQHSGRQDDPCLPILVDRIVAGEGVSGIATPSRKGSPTSTSPRDTPKTATVWPASSLSVTSAMSVSGGPKLPSKWVTLLGPRG